MFGVFRVRRSLSSLWLGSDTEGRLADPLTVRCGHTLLVKQEACMAEVSTSILPRSIETITGYMSPNVTCTRDAHDQL